MKNVLSPRGLTADSRVTNETQLGHITFLEIDHEIYGQSAPSTYTRRAVDS